MSCRTIATGPGMFAIVCDRTRGSVCQTPGCGRTTEALCDYPVVRKERRVRCDRKLCDRCRVRQGPDKDFCPPHAKAAPPRSPQPSDPKRGDHRIHLETGIGLWVWRVDLQGEQLLVTFGRNPPDRGRCGGPMQTVPLDKWTVKTRAPDVRSWTLVDYGDPESNQYGFRPCPKCGSKFAYPFRNKETGIVEACCDECGHREGPAVHVDGQEWPP
jgi:hypothetical protein